MKRRRPILLSREKIVGEPKRSGKSALRHAGVEPVAYGVDDRRSAVLRSRTDITIADGALGHGSLLWPLGALTARETQVF